MKLPQFTLKQLMISMAWICVGCSLLSFAFTSWNLPLKPRYDDLAELERLARFLSFIVGYIAIVSGAVWLVFTKRRTRVVFHATAGGFLGAAIAIVIASPYYAYNQSPKFSPWAIVLLASIWGSILAAIPRVLSDTKDSRQK